MVQPPVDHAYQLLARNFSADMSRLTSATYGFLTTLLLMGCATEPPPTVAKTGADCEEATVCKVEGLLEMSSDGHGWIGIVRLDDGSCVNVSLPEARSRSLLGRPAQHVMLSGKVVYFPRGPDILSFTVSGRKVGYGICGAHFVFVR